VGLAGQQNAGKSTIFNMLTGANQHIANYPGGYGRQKDRRLPRCLKRVEIVDLPGTYSLTSFSLEERVARDFFLRKTRCGGKCAGCGPAQTQPVLHLPAHGDGPAGGAGLQHDDIAESEGQKVDVSCLAETLGLSVVGTVGRKSQGKAELKDAIRIEPGRVKAAKEPATPRW
jgi:ferrous iron transport protein B